MIYCNWKIKYGSIKHPFIIFNDNLAIWMENFPLRQLLRSKHLRTKQTIYFCFSKENFPCSAFLLGCQRIILIDNCKTKHKILMVRIIINILVYNSYVPYLGFQKKLTNILVYISYVPYLCFWKKLINTNIDYPIIEQIFGLAELRFRGSTICRYLK